VFEAFRKEVLALDPCVSEEFMKLYVAYKAEWCRRSSDCALAST
jgi:predicted transport protein